MKSPLLICIHLCLKKTNDNMNTIFYIASSVAIISTALVITRTNAVHALLFLVVSLLSVAVIFFIAGAPFIAALEVIIYAGAIMVLLIFVIMMLNLGKDNKREEKKLMHPKIWIGPAFLSLVLMVLFIYAVSAHPSGSLSTHIIGPKQVGISLFSKYLLGVEISAMILLAGIIGAYHLGKQKKKVVHRFMEEEK